MGRRYSEDTIEAARLRFLEIRDARAVALEMRIPPRTVQGWMLRYNWRGDMAIAERQIAEQISAASVERKKEVVDLAHEALSDTLSKVPGQRIRWGRGEAASAALNLAKTLKILEGQGGDGERGQQVTQQLLIILAEGRGGEDSVEDKDRTFVVSARSP